MINEGKVTISLEGKSPHVQINVVMPLDTFQHTKNVSIIQFHNFIITSMISIDTTIGTGSDNVLLDEYRSFHMHLCVKINNLGVVYSGLGSN